MPSPGRSSRRVTARQRRPILGTWRACPPPADQLSAAETKRFAAQGLPFAAKRNLRKAREKATSDRQRSSRPSESALKTDSQRNPTAIQSGNRHAAPLG